MDGYIIDWLNLLFRWLHLITGAAWIGTSFYFNWLNHNIRPPKDEREGINGELFAVHGGHFYQVSKYEGAPKVLPETLHWFKWEAYFTWITGVSLLVVVYYWNASIYLVDNSIREIEPMYAILTSIGCLVGGWFIYDLMCKSPLTKKPVLFAITGFAMMTGVAYGLTEIFAPRAAYIHVGAIIGTIMAANVFRVIIPAQKNLVSSAENKQKPNLQLSIDAKNRSIHNNYFTLPVLFIMISSHFSFTYGAVNNWLILVVLSLAGILTRHYFNLRNKKQYKVWILPSAALIMFFLMIFSSLSIFDNDKKQISASLELVSFNEVQNIIKYRCGTCHAKNPTFEGIEVAPKGVIYDSANDIIKNLKLIQAQAIDAEIMPPNNLTGITNQEREKLRIWIEQGANINN